MFGLQLSGPAVHETAERGHEVAGDARFGYRAPGWQCSVLQTVHLHPVPGAHQMEMANTTQTACVSLLRPSGRRLGIACLCRRAPLSKPKAALDAPTALFRWAKYNMVTCQPCSHTGYLQSLEECEFKLRCCLEVWQCYTQRTKGFMDPSFQLLERDET